MSRFVVILSLLFILQFGAFTISSLLLALQKFDATTEVNVVAVLVLALLSTPCTVKRLWNLRTQPPHHETRRKPSHRAQSMTHLLAVAWILPAVFGLFIAAKQPMCSLDSNLAVWQQGVGCSFHRALVALSVAIIICEYALHRLLKKQRRLQALEKLGIASRSSIESTVTLEKPGQMHLVPDRLLTLSEQRNLARRNSLSSQRAVYPYGRSTFDSSRSASLNHGSTLSSSNSSGRYARSTVHSASDSSISDKTVSLTLQASRSSASGSLYSRRRPTLDLKAIPESPRIVEPIEPAKPPPAWCPPLKHAPLSADPTIRALVDGAPKAHLIETSKSSCNKPTPIETPEPAIVAAVDTESTSGPAAAATPASPGQPSLIQSTSFPLPPVPAVPKLPPRAPGHPARSKSSGAISNGSSRRARDRYQPSQLNMGGNLRKPSPSPYASKYRGLWTHGQGQVQGTSGWPSGTAWPANQSQGQIPMQSGQNLMVPSMTTGNLAAPHLRPSMYSMSSYGTRSSTGASAVLGGR